MGEFGRVHADLSVAPQQLPDEFCVLIPRPENLVGQAALLRGLFLEGRGRDLRRAVRGEPGAAPFEQAVRDSGRIEERQVEMGLHRIPEQDQVEAIIHVPENPLHAFPHRLPASKRTERS